MIVLLILLFVLFAMEAFFTTMPLVYVFLLTLFIRTKLALLFPIAFFFGILLDMLALRPYGQTSMVYMVVFFLVLLYERKYEVTTVPFFFLSSFFGSMLLLSLYGSSNIFAQSILVAVIGVVFFSILGRVRAQ